MSTHRPETPATMPHPSAGPTPATAETAPDWQEASRWAEHATFDPAAFIPTDPTGVDPHSGRQLLARAGVGRPPLDPTTPPGTNSRARPVRLGRELDARLENHLTTRTRAGEHITASDVIREALSDYLTSHPTRTGSA